VTHGNDSKGQARGVIDRYFHAMRTGAAGGDEMMGLFADDAVYVEPFSGRVVMHTGKTAIRRSYLESRTYAPADLTITLDRIDVEGDRIRTEWTCRAPAFPGPMRGQDLWTIRDGKIHRLETTLASRAADEYAARLAPAQAALVAAVAGLVREAAPAAKESIKWGQPVWEVNGPVCSIKAFRNTTNVNFWRGAELARGADPEGLLEGSGAKLRHIKLTRAEDIRAEAFEQLVRAAVELNQRFGDPTRGEATRARQERQIQ
jgi:hypothetical protein